MKIDLATIKSIRTTGPVIFLEGEIEPADSAHIENLWRSIANNPVANTIHIKNLGMHSFKAIVYALSQNKRISSLIIDDLDEKTEEFFKMLVNYSSYIKKWAFKTNQKNIIDKIFDTIKVSPRGELVGQILNLHITCLGCTKENAEIIIPKLTNTPIKILTIDSFNEDVFNLLLKLGDNVLEKIEVAEPIPPLLATKFQQSILGTKIKLEVCPQQRSNASEKPINEANTPVNSSSANILKQLSNNEIAPSTTTTTTTKKRQFEYNEGIDAEIDAAQLNGENQKTSSPSSNPTDKKKMAKGSIQKTNKEFVDEMKEILPLTYNFKPDEKSSLMAEYAELLTENQSYKERLESCNTQIMYMEENLKNLRKKASEAFLPYFEFAKKTANP